MTTLEQQERAQTEPQRLFVDMDGTLAEFAPVDTLETLYQPGYFSNLAPMENVLEAVKLIIKTHPEVEVYTLSAVLSGSSHAEIEKNQWLDEHLPQVLGGHRVFLPCGADKKDFIPDGIRPTDFLLDDYTHNLTLWEPPAKGIKVMNGINGTHGTWQGHRVDCQQSPEELARDVVGTMYGQLPKQSEASIENIKLEAWLERSNEYNRMLLEDMNYQEDEPERDVAVEQTQAAVQQHSVKDTTSYRNRGGNGQIIQAIKHHFDILEYAQSMGLHFKEKSGRYQCLEHDSMWIDPVRQTFNRFSRGVSGDVIDLKMHFETISMAEAISVLRQEMGGDISRFSPMRYEVFKERQERKAFVLPERHPGKYSRVFSYLINKRCIDPKIIADIVKEGLLYESADYHNCVFVCKDADGAVKAASVRSTGEKKYVGEMEGGNKIGWTAYPNKAALFVTEAPIDAMSVMTMLKNGGKNYRNYSYYAQSGNPPVGVLKNHILHNPNIQTVYLCHDNDEAGEKMAAKAKMELEEGGFKGEIVRKKPLSKDFNQDICNSTFVQTENIHSNEMTTEVAQCFNQ